MKTFEEYANDRLELSDDLKSNFRSWEYDNDNERAAEKLTNILQRRHPDIPESTVRDMAYDWVGLGEE